MFGDPISNSKDLKTVKMEKACFLKAGITTSAEDIHDQSKEYTVPCYGGNGIRGFVKKATQHGIYPIIGRQGALCGNVQLAFGDFHATEHAVLVRPLLEQNEIWLYYLLKLMDLYRYHTGAAQPGLAVKTLNMLDIIIVDKKKQDQFATFVQQVDKSKLAVQKSLEELETLKQALMQQYFGRKEEGKNLEDTGITPIVLEEIKKFAKKNGVKKVILFGSRARGNFERASDIDLAVKGGDITHFTLDVKEETSTLLDFDVINLEEKLQEKLLDSIRKEGIVIYEEI